MRKNEYSRRREEASCGVRGELLNRWSGVRVPAPAPLLYSISVLSPCGDPSPYSHDIANRLASAWLYGARSVLGSSGFSDRCPANFRCRARWQYRLSLTTPLRVLFADHAVRPPATGPPDSCCCGLHSVQTCLPRRHVVSVRYGPTHLLKPPTMLVSRAPFFAGNREMGSRCPIPHLAWDRFPIDGSAGLR
jgi:hypothetical protein